MITEVGSLSTDEERTLRVLLDGLSRIRGRKKQLAYLAEHPVLRDPGVVHLCWRLAVELTKEGIDDRARRYSDLAIRIAGTRDPENVWSIVRLVQAVEGLWEGRIRAIPDVKAAWLAIGVAAHDEFRARLDGLVGAGIMDWCSSGLTVISRILGDPDVLRTAVTFARQAVDETPAEFPQRATFSNNLANRLGELYFMDGGAHLMVESVAVLRESVAATPAGTTTMARRMSNLSVHLADAHKATGDRSHLDEAIDIARNALIATAETDRDYPALSSFLSTRLRELFGLTREGRDLSEAMKAASRAVELANPDRDDTRGFLTNLALCQFDYYKVTGETSDLNVAIATASQALDGTPADSPLLADREANLASFLAERFVIDGSPDDLTEAILLSRSALEATEPSSPHWSRRAANLATRLAQAYSENGDRAELAESRSIIRSAQTERFDDRIRVGRVAAHLSRLDNDLDGAVQALTDALDAYMTEATRLDDDERARRDLARQADGLLSDLAACLALAGREDQAVDRLEDARVWLPVAPAHARTAAFPTTIWVINTRWETVLISEALTEPVTVDLDRRRLRRTLGGALVRTKDGQPDGAVTELVDMTGELTRNFPDVAELVVVPVGTCALLPFGAGSSSNGQLVLERTELTVAPTAGWSEAAVRQRPHGPSFGAFHPGEGGQWPRLDLAADLATFVSSFPQGTILDEPSAEEIGQRFDPDGLVAHFSCHGVYNQRNPMASSLLLETPLRLDAMLASHQINWLVNLSACETAIPDLARSEQMISFPTAFILGGAAHVLGTLWSVGDDQATTYNRSFYSQLIDGVRPATAHRNSVLEVRASSPDPMWWASFTHYGSPW